LLNRRFEILEGKLFERDQDNEAKIKDLENEIDSATDKQAPKQKSNSQLLEEKH